MKIKKMKMTVTALVVRQPLQLFYTRGTSVDTIPHKLLPIPAQNIPTKRFKPHSPALTQIALTRKISKKQEVKVEMNQP